MILDLPVEIRLRLYNHLFTGQRIMVVPPAAEDLGPAAPLRMKSVPLGAQLIRTCRAIYEESHDLLFEENIWDCSQREGLTILTSTIGTDNLALVKHVVIDWEQLQDFAWSLAKEDFRQATSGLHVLELANWRRRAWGDSSFLWKEVRSYERQLCQSALEICEKHTNLRLIAQSTRTPKIATGDARVRWRFVQSEAYVLKSETIISIHEELEHLNVRGATDDRDKTTFASIDPF